MTSYTSYTSYDVIYVIYVIYVIISDLEPGILCLNRSADLLISVLNTVLNMAKLVQTSTTHLVGYGPHIVLFMGSTTDKFGTLRLFEKTNTE